MRSFYLDASALAKRYAPEPGTPLMNHLLALVPGHRLVVLNVGIGEVVSLLVRKRNGGKLMSADFATAMQNVTKELVVASALQRQTASDALVFASLPLLERHAINSTDGIILRSSLDIAAFLRAQGDDLVLVASDQRLIRAAQAEGLVTFNPETQSLADLNALL